MANVIKLVWMGRSAEVNIMQSLKDFVLTEFQKKSNTNAFSKLGNNQLPPFSMTLSKLYHMHNLVHVLLQTYWILQLRSAIKLFTPAGLPKPNLPWVHCESSNKQTIVLASPRQKLPGQTLPKAYQKTVSLTKATFITTQADKIKFFNT